MTDMGTVEYLLKLYAQYFAMCCEDDSLGIRRAYPDEYGHGWYNGRNDGAAYVIEQILMYRFGMRLNVILDDRGYKYNTYRAYNNVCSISVGGWSQYDEN